MSAFLGIAGYEYRMGVRRWGLWLAFLLAGIPSVLNPLFGYQVDQLTSVWQMAVPDGHKPDSGLVVVSTLHMVDGIQYRVVGPDASAYPGAQPLHPSLEDGYVWLMQGAANRALVGDGPIARMAGESRRA